ncbi:MAG: hypothetical protein ACNS62_17335 [Candidatus Cyclobacteriaceae bacterium M3_2C_046]
MNSIAELALRGHFESLRQKVNQETSTIPDQEKLLDLIQKAVGMMEEVYDKDFDLLEIDNADDYREMIETLNQYGRSYQGKPEILLQAQKPRHQTKPVTFHKKPMKKAEGPRTRKHNKERKNTG